MLGPVESTIVVGAIELIEASIVTIVREATLPRVQERLLAESGITVERAAYGVLVGVADHGPVRLTALAAQLGVDASTVSRHVSGLERQGLLVRVGDPTDRRVAQVTLTAAGSEVLDELRSARHRWLAELLAGWPARDRERLGPLLARLAQDFVTHGRGG
jgi:DNA-binding MarR family transcriptional regulator